MISFVIPAHNEELLIGRCVRSIHRAAKALGDDYEIIVADDASTDRTGEIAESLGATVIHIDRLQIAAARNAGAAASRGDPLVFVDADTAVTTPAVRQLAWKINDGATYGGGRVDWDAWVPAWSRVAMRVILVGYQTLGLASGAFLFCRRDAFDLVGGFDESLFAGEEADLCLKLRRIGRHAWVHSPVVTSGRKLRTYSGRELLGEVGLMLLHGRRGLATREHLDLWYGPRRPDPSGPADVVTPEPKPS